MKPVLNWLKGNYWIVVLAVVMLAAPPVAFVFASGWKDSIIETRQSEASTAYQELTRAGLTYSVTPAPGEQPVEVEYAPNPRMIEAFAGANRSRAEALSRVTGTAIEHNRKGRGVLVPALLPSPNPTDSQRLRLEMAREIYPRAVEGRPGAYERLFNELKIRGPLDPEQVIDSLNERRSRELQSMGLGENAEPGGEQGKQIERVLLDHRVRKYRQYASETAAYGGIDILPTAVPFPPVPSEPDTLRQCFLWQFDYWVIEDILRSVAAMSQPSLESGRGVLDAPVKRILAMGVDSFEIPDASSAGGRGGRSARGGRGAPEPVGSGTITGRAPGDSELYDIRTVRLQLVVSTAKLPEVINGLCSYNLVSVLDLDLSEIDAREHMRQGFDYGTEPVVMADIVLETLWLRAWTKRFMPPEIRQALGIPDDPETPDDDGN